MSVRINSEKHPLVSRFVTSVRSSSRLSICISSFPINVFSRNVILRTSRKSFERLQICLKSGKKYISLLHENIYVDSSKKETHSYVFTTRLNGFILFTATCQQQCTGNHSCFSIAKIFPLTRHFFTLYVH